MSDVIQTFSCPLCQWKSQGVVNAESEATIKAHYQSHPIEAWAQCVMVMSNTINMLETMLRENGVDPQEELNGSNEASN